MWEWRIFVAASDTGFVPDLWELVPSPRPWNLRPEKRNDVYVANSVLSGVKLRSKRTLEVKLRSERLISGVERWHKVLHASLNYDPKSGQSLTTAIVDKLTACRDGWSLSCSPTPERKQAIHDTLALSSSPPSTISLFTLNKERMRYHTQSVALEQTDITVEEFESVKWRTIAIEGDLEKVLSFLQSEVKVKTSFEMKQMLKLQDYLVELSGEPCGYPEFILKLKTAS